MANKQGGTIDGPLLIREGGLILGDINEGPYTIRENFARITITAAQMKALNATPITIIPAPGVGKVLEFMNAQAYLKFGTTAYAGIALNEDLVMRFTDASGPIVSNTLETTGFLDQVTNQIRTCKRIPTDLIPVANSPIVLMMLNGEITTGDSPMDLSIAYRIHETGL